MKTSGAFIMSTTTRSPGATPSSRRPPATQVARECNSALVYHVPSYHRLGTSLPAASRCASARRLRLCSPSTGSSTFMRLLGDRRNRCVPGPICPTTYTPSRLTDRWASLIACRVEATSMADADDVRRLALSLPHVVEIDSDGFDFRVADKGFVWSYPERLPGRPRFIRTDVAVLFVGDEAEKQALPLGEPDVFFTNPGYDGLPLVMLRLAKVNVKRLRELVTDAWRMRAPAAIAGDLDK